MLTRSHSKQANQNTILSRSIRTPYYLRNLPMINYFEHYHEDDDDNNDDDNNDEDYYLENNYDQHHTEIEFIYNNVDVPGPYDDTGPYCGSRYCDYCGSNYYYGSDGYDN